MDEQPAGWNLSVAYLVTLGLYAIARSATHFTVTDRRVIHTSGIITRKQRSVPVHMVQDASVTTQLGVGHVNVSAAGGPLSTLRLGPMGSETAHRMSDAILHARRSARQ